jgi:hypothetical protein
MSTENGGPISWRDTYALVEGVEQRLGEKIDGLAKTVTALQLERAGCAGEARGRAQVVGWGKAGIAAVVALGGFAGGAAAAAAAYFHL